MVNLWTEDDFTLIEDTTTGRRAMLWPSGSREERGSTGLRDITGLCVDGVVASGSLLIERIGSEVTLYFDQLVLATGDGTVNLSLLTDVPSTLYQFRPKRMQSVSHLASSSGHVERLVVESDMRVNVHFALAAGQIRAQVKWSTEAGWPSALPGVAYGEPVGV